MTFFRNYCMFLKEFFIQFASKNSYSSLTDFAGHFGDLRTRNGPQDIQEFLLTVLKIMKKYPLQQLQLPWVIYYFPAVGYYLSKFKGLKKSGEHVVEWTKNDIFFLGLIRTSFVILKRHLCRSFQHTFEIFRIIEPKTLSIFEFKDTYRIFCIEIEIYYQKILIHGKSLFPATLQCNLEAKYVFCFEDISAVSWFYFNNYKCINNWSMFKK